MLQLVRDMEQGKPAGFTLDGPRGPARVAQPGASGWRGRPGTRCCRFTWRRRGRGRWGAGTGRRSRSRSGPWRSWSGSRSPVAPDATDAQLEQARGELESRLSVLEQTGAVTWSTESERRSRRDSGRARSTRRGSLRWIAHRVNDAMPARSAASTAPPTANSITRLRVPPLRSFGFAAFLVLLAAAARAQVVSSSLGHIFPRSGREVRTVRVVPGRSL